jgi:acyl transferase domain-containing protein
MGVEPSALVGHSSGEIAAAYAVGAITATEAITVAFHRGQVTKRQSKIGAMAAIGISWAEVEKFLLPGVNVACENSPRSVAISGDADKVEAVVAAIQKSEPDALARMLKVDKAYHSHHMADVGAYYYSLLETEVTGQDPGKRSSLVSRG